MAAVQKEKSMNSFHISVTGSDHWHFQSELKGLYIPLLVYFSFFSMHGFFFPGGREGGEEEKKKKKKQTLYLGSLLLWLIKKSK